jgi:hypothetical protein
MSVRPWMGASFGYAGVDSLDMSCGYRCRGLSREQCVLLTAFVLIAVK